MATDAARPDLSAAIDVLRATVAADDAYRAFMQAGAADELRTSAMAELILALDAQRPLLDRLDALATEFFA